MRPWCRCVIVVAASAVLACDSGGADGGGQDAAGPTHVVLDPEPAGAPTQVAGGRLTCLGSNDPGVVDTSALELTGYVRTLADPEAKQPPPAAHVVAYAPDGTELGEGYADESKAGRVAFTVPVGEGGFDGHVVVTHEGYIDWRFETSKPVADTALSGWAWLTTEQEATERAEALGITLQDDKGILVGAVHDCDGLGVDGAVVLVGGSNEGVVYVEGFDLAPERSFTTDTGRFVVPNVPPGPVQVEAYGRLEDGGPLVLLSRIEATVEAGRITAVDLQPLGSR